MHHFMAVNVHAAEVVNLGVNFYSTIVCVLKLEECIKVGDNISNCKTWAKNNKLSYLADKHCVKMADKIDFSDQVNLCLVYPNLRQINIKMGQNLKHSIGDK